MSFPPPTDITWYMSGPIAGDVERNIQRFHDACAELRPRGYTILSPVEVHTDEELAERRPWEWYMRRDIIKMMQDEVRGIILLPGWEYSRGAKVELTLAKGLEFQVVLYENCLARPKVEA